MAYRENLDAFARQRARDDDELALLASFHRGERSRRRRAIATWISGLAVVGLIYAVSLAGPMPRHRARHVVDLSPQSIARHVAADFEYAAAKQRARVHRAMQAYLIALDAQSVNLFDLDFDANPAVSQGMQPLSPSDLGFDLAAAAAPGTR